jgi:hypothetical protein
VIVGCYHGFGTRTFQTIPIDFRQHQTTSKMADSHWDCLICGKPIDDAAGMSLDGTTEFHLCEKCYAKLPPEVKLAECRAWRESTSRRDCLREFERLCRAATGSSALSFITRDRGSPN